MTAAALLGGIGGLVAMGALLDRGLAPYGAVLALLGVAQVASLDRRAVVPGDSPPRARGPGPNDRLSHSRVNGVTMPARGGGSRPDLARSRSARSRLARRDRA